MLFQRRYYRTSWYITYNAHRGGKGVNGCTQAIFLIWTCCGLRLRYLRPKNDLLLLLTNWMMKYCLIFRRGHLKCTPVPNWKVLHNHFVRNTVHVHRRNVPNGNPTFSVRHMLHVRQDWFNGSTTNSIISKQ